jgi:hypothetical protein
MRWVSVMSPDAHQNRYPFFRRAFLAATAPTGLRDARGGGPTAGRG